MAAQDWGPKPPVFIVGAPRSGTTLLRNLLARHPNLAICGETRFYRDVYKRRRVFGDLSKPRNRSRLVDRYLATRRVQQLDMDMAGLREKLLREAASYPDLLRCMLEYHAALQGKVRWGEKTPHHAFCTELLSEWYPGARILHLVRDPRDVVASLQEMPWASRSIIGNAMMWRLFNRAARRSSHRGGYLLVQYEALAADPVRELERICSHLGETYAPSMLSDAEAGGEPYSWPRGAGGPVTGSRQNQWRSRLSEQDASLVEWIAKRDMQLYGYPAACRPASLPGVSRGLALAAARGIRGRMTQLPYLWFYLTQPSQLAKQEYWKYRGSWEKTATYYKLASWSE